MVSSCCNIPTFIPSKNYFSLLFPKRTTTGRKKSIAIPTDWAEDTFSMVSPFIIAGWLFFLSLPGSQIDELKPNGEVELKI